MHIIVTLKIKKNNAFFLLQTKNFEKCKNIDIN